MRLYLCEKPPQGKDIARVLGVRQRDQGCYIGPELAVTWCIGHLIESAEPESYGDHYKRWSLEHLPIIPERWRVQVKPSTAEQFKIVQRLLKSATQVVIATDADREGEMIAREVLEFCAYGGPIQRLWLSALNDASIRKALGALRPGRETLPLYHAALGRARADWLVGMNLTRLFTVIGRKAGYDGVLSVGRVQTPTLALVVRRDREIAAFVPVPYWSIETNVSIGARTFVAQWIPPAGTTDEAGRCLRHDVAQAAADRLRTQTSAEVTSVKTEHVCEPPPLPFELGTLQQVCSQRLGLDVQETLRIAQALYETHKATTYPRTDCGYLPGSMLEDVPQVLTALVATDPTLEPLVNSLDRAQRSRAWNDREVTAHHGIIPTLEPIRLSAMSDSERAVYRLIRGRYLAQFLPHYEYDRTVVQLACAGEGLRARGQQIAAQGWRVALPGELATVENDEAATRSQVLPTLTSGMRCALESTDLKALKTTAPKPYTQGELIAAMKGIARFVSDPRLKQKLKEAAGIGTEATRAAIIEGLIARGYLLKKSRDLRASAAAFSLLDAVPAALADPGTTALWEQALDLVAAGRMTTDDFVQRQSTWVRQLVRDSSLHAPLAFRKNTAPSMR